MGRVKSKYRNQRKDVLDFMKVHGSITQIDAYRKFPAPITRLSAVIYDLRKAGNVIEGEWESSNNCYGPTRFKRYKLLESVK